MAGVSREKDFESYETKFKECEPKSYQEGLNLILHVVMIEGGFRPESSDLEAGGIPKGWRNNVATLAYKHEGFRNFDCTVVIVQMGETTQFLVSFPGQESKITTEFASGDLFVSSADKSKEISPKFEDFKISSINRKIKTELLYPLQVAAHERLGVPAPWHLSGLPHEVLTNICAFLPFQSVLSLGRTSKRLNSSLSDNNLWHKLYCRDFDKQNKDLRIGWKEEYKEKYTEKKAKERDAQMRRNVLLEDPDILRNQPRFPNPYPNIPPNIPHPGFGDPDSPYFGGEIPNPMNPMNPGLIGQSRRGIIQDPNPLGLPNNPFDDPSPLGLGPRRGGRRDPFGGPFGGGFGGGFGGFGGGGRGPSFDFL